MFIMFSPELSQSRHWKSCVLVKPFIPKQTRQTPFPSVILGKLTCNTGLKIHISGWEVGGRFKKEEGTYVTPMVNSC